MTYGEKIASLRKQRNMTQAELGELLHVSFQAVSKWENGLSEPDLDTIKRMCEIFNITTNEFFGMEAESQQSTTEETPDPVETNAKPVGYCEKCKKPLYKDEDVVAIRRSHRTGRHHRITTHKYCKECGVAIQSTTTRQPLTKKEEAEKMRKETAHQRKVGFIWGAVGGVVLSVILIVTGVETNDNLLAILGGILGVYGGFAFISQMIWMNSVMDCFCFFLKSFHLPGLIFTLDLDGIIWFLTVKLIGSILCAILSVLLFSVGIVVTIGYSMISFPVALIRQLKGEYED